MVDERKLHDYANSQINVNEPSHQDFGFVKPIPLSRWKCSIMLSSHGDSNSVLHVTARS